MSQPQNVFVWRGPWQDNINYIQNDRVSFSNYTYLCNEQHISSSNITISDINYWSRENKPFGIMLTPEGKNWIRLSNVIIVVFIMIIFKIIILY